MLMIKARGVGSIESNGCGSIESNGCGSIESSSIAKRHTTGLLSFRGDLVWMELNWAPLTSLYPGYQEEVSLCHKSPFRNPTLCPSQREEPPGAPQWASSK